MNANREFKLISQKFNIPHNFSSYSWEIRESVVLREQIDSKFYVYGEIAPTPGFRNSLYSQMFLRKLNLESFSGINCH